MPKPTGEKPRYWRRRRDERAAGSRPNHGDPKTCLRCMGKLTYWDSFLGRFRKCGHIH